MVISLICALSGVIVYLISTSGQSTPVQSGISSGEFVNIAGIDFFSPEEGVVGEDERLMVIMGGRDNQGAELDTLEIVNHTAGCTDLLPE